MRDISFIILSWNSENYLSRCIDSIVKQCILEAISYEFIVIDNGSEDGSMAIVNAYEQRDPKSFIGISLNSNRGTTYTRNLGLKKAQSEYVCIIDSDTEIGSGSFRPIMDVLKTKEEIGIIAPKLLLPDGSVQNSVKRFPTMWHKLKKVPGILLKLKTRNMDFYQDFPFATDREVDSAISACWIFRKELIIAVGLLDERIFYSPEDLDYCLRVRKTGYSIVYGTSLEILHHTQQISHKNPFSTMAMHHLKGLLYYYFKHGGWISRPQY